MNRKTILVSALISAVVAMLTTAAVFVVLFKQFGEVKTIDPHETAAENKPTPTPMAAPTIPNEEIKAADVDAVTIDTVYKEFFAEGEKCRQTYQQYFKNTDGVESSSSPCNVTLTVKRDGRAEKTIEVRGYDRATKQWRTVEKNVWKAEVTESEFGGLVDLIVNNEAFKNWRDGIMINVSNCTISVKHKKGTKSPMSNVDSTATAYLPMVEAFKRLDAKAVWKKAE